MARRFERRSVFRWCGGAAALLWLAGAFDLLFPAREPSPECWRAPPLTSEPSTAAPWGRNRTAQERQLVIGTSQVALPPLPLDLTDTERAVYERLREKSTEADLVRAAAFASGLTEASEVARFEARIRVLARRLEPLATVEDPVRRTNDLLVLLHQGLLRNYSEKQPYPAAVLDTGLFDCAASTILFNIFATHLGLQVEAVGEPDHVFSVVTVDGHRYGVGTTIANGFATPLDSKEAGLLVSNAALIGMAFEDRLAFNHDSRPLSLEASDEASLGVELALWRRIVALSPGDLRARKNLTGALHNLSSWLHHHNRPDEAYELAREALAVAPEPAQQKSVRLDLSIAAGDRMQAFLKTGAVAEAGVVLERAEKDLGCALGAPECQPLVHEASAVLFEAGDALRVGKGKLYAQLVALMATELPPDQPDVLTPMAIAAAQSLWSEDGRACAEGFVQTLETPAVCLGHPRLFCDPLAHWAALRWLAFSPAKALRWVAAR
jgi:hypothetical protein